MAGHLDHELDWKQVRFKGALWTLSTIGAVSTLVISADIARYISIGGLSGLGVLAVWQVFDLVSARRIRTRRGILAVGGERMRAKEFAQVWTSAKDRILCTGVGMTGILKEDDLVRATVRRGVRVEFALMDPEWLRRQPDLSASVDDFYGRKDFFRTVEESLEELIQLRNDLNAEYGRDFITIRTVKHFAPYSGTIADYGTKDAQGYIEFHLYRSPLGRFRMRVKDYRAGGSESPPLMYHWLAAQSRAVGQDYVGPLRPASRNRSPVMLHQANDSDAPRLEGK